MNNGLHIQTTFAHPIMIILDDVCKMYANLFQFLFENIANIVHFINTMKNTRLNYSRGSPTGKIPTNAKGGVQNVDASGRVERIHQRKVYYRSEATEWMSVIVNAPKRWKVKDLH